MCGIVGFVDPQGQVQDPPGILTRMRDALAHRGPDQEGFVHRGAAHFGHQRLAIVDPSEAGRQPFEHGSTVVVANGEIYNHLELRERFFQASKSAIPASDCAILPYLWERRGRTFVHDLSGMYAFALYDETQECLVLARDPAGQKPLYYAPLPGGGIAFASELKALLQHPQVSREIDPLALRQFLAFDYVPGERSIYRSVLKVPPGSSLTWQAGKLSTERTFLPPPSTPSFRTLEDGAEAVWTSLLDSVRARLMSDVPIGVFLSGGIDSAAIVAAMSELRDASSIRTFSIGFDDKAFDESLAAEQIANHFGTTHRTSIINSEQVVQSLPRIMETLDEPFADASYVPTYLLSEFVAQEVKVILSGDGGDELFLGYPTFYAEQQVSKAKLMPRLARDKIILPLITALSKSNVYMPAEFRWRRFLRGLDLPAGQRHISWIGGIDAREHHSILREPYRLEEANLFKILDTESSNYAQVNPKASTLERLAHQYLRTYLAEGVLQKVDRASMAHGLEVRSPFLSTQMMEVAARCSVDHKIRGKETKRVLRRALQERLPTNILSRPKRGFALPMAQWLQRDLKPWMLDLLSPSSIEKAGIFDPEMVTRWVSQHLEGSVSRHKELWTLLSFETWRQGPHGPQP